MIYVILILQLILLGGAGYMIYMRDRKNIEWLDLLLRYIKPDTYIKQKGSHEVLSAVQSMLFELQKKKADTEREKETKLFNGIK